MWLSNDLANELVVRNGAPLFAYSKDQLRARAQELLELELPFGHTVRYAVKANPHLEIISLFSDLDMHFDASSSYEVTMLLEQGIPGDRISLSSQQSAHNLQQLLGAGVRYVATSMHQVELFAEAAGQGANVALRVNPSLDSAGHNNRTSTGGVASSFGLWHEYVEQALAYANSKQITIERVHIHVGSGADPAIWESAMESALSIVRRMPDVTTLDIGGGYKVSRAPGEQEADMVQIAKVFADKLQSFAEETGRELALEIEPGTWLVAHAGVLIAQVNDIVDTGPDGYKFLRLNTGMNDIIRPAMYGSHHGIQVLNGSDEEVEYVVVGHNCETGDILTPMPGDPEHIAPRLMQKAEIGDTVAIADAGAYCASFSVQSYNAFPSAKEVFVS
jgi:diaminopimelate decarboxylase